MSTSLTTYDCIPTWEHVYIYSKDDLQDASDAQKKFYNEYKDAFKKGIYYDLSGNTNYCFILLFDFLDEYHSRVFGLDRLKSELHKLSETYPSTHPYVVDILIKAFLKENRYTDAWVIKKQSSIFTIDDVVQFELLLKRSLIDDVVIKSIAGVSCLTPYGRDYADEIFVFAEPIVRQIEKVKGCKLSSMFIRSIKWEEYNLSEYEQYYSNKKEYKNYCQIDQGQTDFRRGTDAIPHTVRHGIQAYLRMIARQAENAYRESRGLPKIGEGWIGETELYYFIKELLPKCTVVHHARPDWLSPQHLDIYIYDHNIALEYQGEQHFRPVEHFGGEEAYKNNVRRDAIKREKCEANGCILICIDKTHNQDYVRDVIQKLIRKTKK